MRKNYNSHMNEKTLKVEATKNSGPCGEFKGNVCFCFVFVSTPMHRWNKKKINKFFSAYYEARDAILEEAKRYDVPLSIESGYFNFKIWKRYHLDDEWLRYLLKKKFKQNEANLCELYHFYAKEYHYDSTPFIFVFNFKGRAYAQQSIGGPDSYCGEKVVLFSKGNIDYDAYTIFHEVLHLYGAIDFYYPESIRKITEQYFDESIMLNPSPVVDPVSAYLIGWIKEKDKNIEELLIKIEEIRRSNS